jgi:hypothetical protein
VTRLDAHYAPSFTAILPRPSARRNNNRGAFVPSHSTEER